MKRVLFIALICAAYFVLNYRAAVAAVEFCPATLNMHAVGKVVAGEPAQIYGFELEAYGPRTVTATLAFDTDQGWYTAELPKAELTEHDRTYYGPNSSFIRKEWASPAMYVRFPTGVVIKHAWVNTALSFGDTFGWENQGVFECLPSTARISGSDTTTRRPAFTTHDLEFSSLPPRAGAITIVPKPAAALQKVDCAKPFADATVTDQARPDFPDSAREAGVGIRSVGVTTALRADGSLADAWVSSPSGVNVLDQAALNAAKGSKYQNALMYCQDVPSFYYFLVTFNPGF